MRMHALITINIFNKFWHSGRGATAIEYALIMGLVFLAIVGAVQGLGQEVATTFYDKIASVL